MDINRSLEINMFMSLLSELSYKYTIGSYTTANKLMVLSHCKDGYMTSVDSWPHFNYFFDYCNEINGSVYCKLKPNGDIQSLIKTLFGCERYSSKKSMVELMEFRNRESIHGILLRTMIAKVKSAINTAQTGFDYDDIELNKSNIKITSIVKKNLLELYNNDFFHFQISPLDVEEMNEMLCFTGITYDCFNHKEYNDKVIITLSANLNTNIERLHNMLKSKDSEVVSLARTFKSDNKIKVERNV